MISSHTSDLASNFRLSQRGIELRQSIQQASVELTTGKKSDLAKATQGRLDTVFAIDRKLKNIDVFSQTIAMAQARSATAQNSLGITGDALTHIGVEVLAAVERGDLVAAKTYGNQSRVFLGGVISALNTQVGGQVLFSGADYEGAALAPADQIISDVAAIVAAAPDTITALNDINTYFDDPAGGYATSIYQGATIDAPSLSLSEGLEANPLVRADAEGIRDAIRILAVSTVIAEGGFAGDPVAQETVLTNIARDSLDARDKITYLRQQVGYAEGLIADASASNASEKSTLEIARNNLTSADPFEVATRVQELQTQLESLYVLTSRMSGLTLTSFLR